MTITKADLAETLNDEIGLNKREAKDFVEMFFEKVRLALEESDSVKLSGFGNFNVRQKNKDRVETQKQVRRFQFQPVGWSPSRLVRNLRGKLKTILNIWQRNTNR